MKRYYKIIALFCNIPLVLAGSKLVSAAVGAPEAITTVSSWTDDFDSASLDSR